MRKYATLAILSVLTLCTGCKTLFKLIKLDGSLIGLYKDVKEIKEKAEGIDVKINVGIKEEGKK